MSSRKGKRGPTPPDTSGDDDPPVNGSSQPSGSDQNGHSSMNARQDPTERRLIRREYSLIKEQTQANRHDLINPGSDKLAKTLEKTEALFKKVKETREAALDSQVVAIISQLAKQQAQALHTDFCVFEPAEFAEKLITLVGGHELPEAEKQRARLSRDGWIKLGEAAQPFFKRSPALHCIFGTFERGPPKQRAPGSRQARNHDAVVEKGPTQPKQLSSFAETEKHEVTTVEVEKMLDTLQQIYQRNDEKPLCYFEFVMNPFSYGLTIENMFYASFLVRDGHARIFLDEEKLPVIEPIEKTSDEDEIRRLPRHQVVMSLNQEEWKELVDTFNITQPLIKPRSADTEGPSTSKRPAKNSTRR